MDARAVRRGHSAAFIDLKSALFSYRTYENRLLVGLEYSIERQIIRKKTLLRARADLNEQTLRQET